MQKELRDELSGQRHEAGISFKKRRAYEQMPAAYYTKRPTLNTYYKCKNDYENNLAIQNEIFKIYDFDFGGGQVETMFA